MSEHPSQRFDATLGAFLAARADDVEGMPSATDVVQAIAATRFGATRPSRSEAALRLALVTALLALAAGLAAILLAGRNRPTGIESLPAYGFATTGETVSVDAQGGILLTRIEAGLLSVVRYRPDGSIDTDFGDGGIARLPGSWLDNAIAIARSGKHWLVLRADEKDGFVLTRHSPHGELDASFGQAGVVELDFPHLEKEGGPATVLSRADGRIFVVGTTTRGIGVQGLLTFEVHAFTSIGRVDAAFGAAGRTVIDAGAGRDTAFTALLVDDGSLLIAGQTGYMTPGPLDNDAVVARIDRDGRRVPEWGNRGTGTVRVHVGETLTNSARSIALRPAGGVAIEVWTASGTYIALTDASGELVSGFGDAGLFYTGLGSADVTVQSDGKVLVAGDGRITRLDQAGVIDTSFGEAGSARYP